MVRKTTPVLLKGARFYYEFYRSDDFKSNEGYYTVSQLMLLGTGPRHLAAAITQFARDTAEGPVNRFFEVNQGREKLDMEDLWKAVFDDKMSSGALNQARIAKSGVLVTNLTSTVRKWELAKQLDAAVDVMAQAQQVNALQHAGVQWYHEEYMPREANVKMAEPVR